MKTFLLKGKKPTIKWTYIPHETYFDLSYGLPEGFSLGVSPHNPYIIVDVDRHEGKEDGFTHIPAQILEELEKTLCYDTPSKGKHYWLKYTGGGKLMNKPSGLGIDLRTEKGYVRFYLPGDIREYMDKINETSLEMNNWLECLFLTKNKRKKR